MTKAPVSPQGRNLANLAARLGSIEYRAIDELTLPARRLRTHSEKQLCRIAASIRENGFIVPVLVSGKLEIISGTARVEAARQAGLTEVPTIRVDHLSEAQVRAFRIADNRLAQLAGWNDAELAAEIEEILAIDDGMVELLGWETAEIDVMLDTSADQPKQEDPADAIPECPAIPTSRTSDLWLLGNHRVLCGSSLEAAAWTTLMNEETARMAFLDVPYNVPVNGHVCGLGKKKHCEFQMASGEMTEPEFTAFLGAALEAAAERCSDGGVLDVCIDWRGLYQLQTAARDAGLSLINLCVWAKTNGGMGSLYRSQHELVLILKKGTAPHINNVQLGKHGRYRTNLWTYPGINSFSQSREADLNDHPTVKPIALVAEAIRDVTRHGDIVVDGFLGSGTTLLAAERTGRRGYGIEIEPKYVDVAIRRWEKLTGKSAVLAATSETFAEVRASRESADAIMTEAA